MIIEWIINKLESVSDRPRLLVSDALRLLPETDGAIHRFARDHQFTVIVASTNLVFRELYERALASPEVEKIMVIDRAPLRRKLQMSTSKAPPPFYPDFSAELPDDARVDLDLRQLLIEKTGDPRWPMEINNPMLARLVAAKLEAVLTAHKKLRTIEPQRFTDNDLKTIVAFAALGLPELAFSIPQPEDHWKMGMLGHETLDELEAVAPEITNPIREGLRKAPVPFCWFAERNPDDVVRVFYLVAILSQHSQQWKLVMKAIDPDITGLDQLSGEMVRGITPKLVAINPEQAAREVRNIEKWLSKQQMQVFLYDGIQANDMTRITSIIIKESLSNLVRSSGLLLALEDLLSPAQKMDHEVLLKHFKDEPHDTFRLVEIHPSQTWDSLKKSYLLAAEITSLHKVLADFRRLLSTKNEDDLLIENFLEYWNKGGVSRIEYYLSSLERLLWNAELLPAAEDLLPSIFPNALERSKELLKGTFVKVEGLLCEINRRFQQLIRRSYPGWLKGQGNVVLTNRFFKDCVKPHWDHEKEKAAIFVFDGMRIDIWDELLKPLVEDKLDCVREYVGMSLLPTETHVSRKAIFAGMYPDGFDSRAAENDLMSQTMKREFRISDAVEVIEPQGPRTGETVRYRCGKMDVYIFELCDKELHKIPMKSRQDGTWEPARPMSFIYQQHLKNIIETEVMSIIRRLEPGTRVFIVADHGFGLTGRERIRVNTEWVNEPGDCKYQNAYLRNTLETLFAPGKVKQSVIEFDINELRLVSAEQRYDRKSGGTLEKTFKSIIFPVAGYAFSRPGYPFNPDAFSHGGISLQEMLVPMLAMKVREHDHGILSVGNLEGQDEILEGEEARFTLELKGNDQVKDVLRVDIDGSWGKDNGRRLAQQVVYVSRGMKTAEIHFTPDLMELAKEEREKGEVSFELSMVISWHHDSKTHKQNRLKNFQVRLNPERVIRRVPAHLGAILGLTPKNMRR